MLRRAPLFLVLLALPFVTRPSSADWPMARHDHLRTSTGDGSSSIAQPAAAFRYYLGGSLGPEQYVGFDVDGDGDREVLFLMGGALLAKTPTDAVVWETEALDLSRIDGLHDLDGDGAPELIATARAGRVHVIEPTDGAVRWSLPSGVVGNVGNVRFADFDDDGVLDLYFSDAACGSTGSLGDVAEAYDFSSDVTAPTRLFALERGRRDYVCGNNDTIVDIDGDGDLEVVAQGRYRFYIYSGVDGSFESESEDVGSIPYALATTVLADVDDDGRNEILAFTENNYTPGVTSRRVFLMDYDTPTSTLVRRWERTVADTVNDRHAFGAAAVPDLLSDGSFEVVTSFYDGALETWTTWVLNAANGAELDSIPVGPFHGVADLDDDGSPEIVVGDRDVGLSAFRYTATGLERVFTAPDMEPVRVRDEPRHRTASARTQLLSLDLDDDGLEELIARRFGASGDSLVALSAATDPPTDVATRAIEADVSFLTFEVFPSVTRDYPQILVARSDGYLHVLDDRLAPTNATTGGEIPLRGLRIGGYYSGSNGFGTTPVAADLDGTPGAEILARDSRGVLLSLSPIVANLVEPPTVAFEVAGAVLPTITDLTGDGTPEILMGVRATPDVIQARGPTGTLLWEREVGTASRTLAYDLVPGQVGGDATLDVAYQLRESSGGTVVINVLNGVDGAPLWATDYETAVAGSGLGANALYDYDGNGLLDVLATPRNLFVWLSAADGSEIASADGGYPAHGSFHDVDGDAALELFTSGSVYGLRRFDLPMVETWSDTTGLHTRVLGALAQCSGGARWIQGSNNSAQLTMWTVSDGARVADIALRGGERYSPPDAVVDGPGVLGNVTISPSLTGGGGPTALVGSTDGHLYAVDPCTGDLVWALDFRFPVGEAILADTDGDLEDEILVTVADGFLYGIDREVLARPLFVVENDGSGPATGPGDDIDELITTDTLYANWASVAGATAYEYAVITPGGAFLTEPNFINVGNATQVTASSLPLTPGRRYLFAVRAIGDDGTSSEQLSDGVTVLPDPCDDCIVGQICVDYACVADPCLGVSCATGQICVAGDCVGRDGGVGTDGGLVPVDGGPGTTSGGCCSVAGTSGLSARGAMGIALLIMVALLRRRRR